MISSYLQIFTSRSILLLLPQGPLHHRRLIGWIFVAFGVILSRLSTLFYFWIFFRDFQIQGEFFWSRLSRRRYLTHLYPTVYECGSFYVYSFYALVGVRLSLWRFLCGRLSFRRRFHLVLSPCYPIMRVITSLLPFLAHRVFTWYLDRRNPLCSFRQGFRVWHHTSNRGYRVRNALGGGS